MILGRGNGDHGIPPFGPALIGATHFEYSPNGKYFATDPGNNLWVSGEAGPFAIPIPHGKSCALTQWTWLPDSSGLAYVKARTTPSLPISFRLTLGTVPRTGGKPHVQTSNLRRDQLAIDLAPAYRRIGRGG